MKIIKTNEGNVAIILSPDEINQMVSINQIQSLPVSWEYGFHKNTIAFLRELKITIGNETVKRNDPRVKMLIRKYYITAIIDILRKLSDRGLAEFTKIYGDGQGSAIGTFKLKF